MSGASIVRGGLGPDDRMVSVAAAMVREDCRGIADAEERLRAAMRSARDLWLDLPDPSRFRAAVAAAMVETPDQKEREAIAASYRMLHALDAAVQGVAVDFEAEAEKAKAAGQTFPLLGLWHEVTEEVKGHGG